MKSLRNLLVLLMLSLPAFAAHSVTLSWNASSSAPSSIDGYNIYRSTTTGTGYVFAATVGPTILTVTDSTNLVEGITYFYVARATWKGAESINSNEASFAVPVTAPQPPQNLKAVGQ